MVHQFDPDMLPDSEFVPGDLKYLVPGNHARMLDARRTPVRVVEVKLAPGFFTVEILAFEDQGARWDLPLEWASLFQFARDRAEAPPDQVGAFEEAIARLDRPLQIPADPSARAETERRIAALRVEVRAWLAADSRFLKTGSALDFSSRVGPPALRDDLKRYMAAQGLWELEDAFARQWVSNPYAGEMVKGHSIVLAELGLVPFDGRQIRDPSTFLGNLDKARRAQHIIHRLAFVREVLARLGHEVVVLYRGTAFTRPLRQRAKGSLTAATFSLAVAMSLFNDRDPKSAGQLVRQPVPCTRLFMSYLETDQMNRQYSEAEAVLLSDGSNELF